jgi:hypothetical protein
MLRLAPRGGTPATQAGLHAGADLLRLSPYSSLHATPECVVDDAQTLVLKLDPLRARIYDGTPAMRVAR